jgi:asparagine synthase (glutamine-hydrolysing)
MLNSLEVRAPFLDIELVDFVRRIPHEYKWRKGQTKYILKKALEPILPREILYRPKKGFGVPIGKWFMEGTLACGEVSIPGLSASFISKVTEQHQTGRHDHRAFLWNLWLLQQWQAAR